MWQNFSPPSIGNALETPRNSGPRSPRITSMRNAATELKPVAPPATRGFEIKPGLSANLNVTLWGDLGLGWLGRLCSALARRGISIQTAQAVRRPDDSWRGTLELDTTVSSADPLSLDYVALSAEDASRADELSPALDRFRIERTETGTISLRLFGLDRIGLLSGLLERMEFLGLFPERLRVTTSGQFVDDTIWLRGVAGHMPSPSAEQALYEMLSKLRSASNNGGD
jgi:hypothetical protein